VGGFASVVCPPFNTQYLCWRSNARGVRNPVFHEHLERPNERKKTEKSYPVGTVIAGDTCQPRIEDRGEASPPRCSYLFLLG
jgi:hypothetical protein